MIHSLHNMTVEREEKDGTFTEWRIYFYLIPPSGDGWHDPIDPGRVEFAGVTMITRDKAPEKIWDWAEEEFDKRRDEAMTIAHEDHDREREYANEMRAEQRREDRR